LTEYSKWSKRNSFRPDCKSCVNKKQKQYLTDNPDQRQITRDRSKRIYLEKRNAELPELIENLKTIRVCTTCGYQGAIEEFVPSKSVVEIISKVRLNATCLPCDKIRRQSWIESHPENMKRIYKKTYNRRRQDMVYRENLKKYQSDKLKTDPVYREKKQQRDRENKRTSPFALWRRLLQNTLSQMGKIKDKKTYDMLGYTSDDLRKHLGEKAYLSDHVDHKIPVSWFCYETPANIVCGLDNLSWLSEQENLKKNNWYANSVSFTYWNTAKDFIIDEYKDRFIQDGNMVFDKNKEIILDRWNLNLSCVD
jgi:hypothetical protein